MIFSFFFLITKIVTFHDRFLEKEQYTEKNEVVVILSGPFCLDLRL